MKTFFYILLSVISLSCSATTYYVSASGSNSNNGTSTGTPWQTISKVNGSTFGSGDIILFNRGDIFFGSIIVNRSNISFGAYGTGAKPIITGYTTVTGWTVETTGLYKADFTGKGTIRIVTIDGTPQEQGRTPNSGLGRSSWNYYENCTGTTVIKDYQLTGSPSRVGQHIVLKTLGWTGNEYRITAHTDSALTITPGRHQKNGNALTPFSLTKNFGYFFVGSKGDCNAFGEWANDTATSKLYLFFGGNTPSSYTVKAAIVDTLVNAGAFDNVSISNIKFDGSNAFGIYSRNGSFITVDDCDFSNIGITGVHCRTDDNVTVTDNTFNYCLSTAIQTFGANSTTGLVSRNSITNGCAFEGAYQNFDSKTDGVGIASEMNNMEISYNYVDGTAYHGIVFGGNNAFVYRNTVRNASKYTTDNGLIYSFSSNTSTPTTLTNRIVRENLLVNGLFGNTNGMPANSDVSTKGLYADDWTMNVIYEGNVIDSVSVAISCNSNENITFRNNFFRSMYGMRVTRKLYNDPTGVVIKNNINIVTDAKASLVWFEDWDLNQPTVHTIASTLAGISAIDSNYHYGPSFKVTYYAKAGGNLGYKATNYSLAQWQSLTSKSAKDSLITWDLSQAQLFYNWNNYITATSIPGTYKALGGQIYSTNLNLQPYKYAFIVKDGSVISVPAGKTFFPARIKQ